MNKEHKGALEERGVVYQIPFQEPSKNVYTGQTKRPLAIRVGEHMSQVRRGDSARSSLAEHCLISAETPDFERVKIIARAPNYRKRIIYESLGRFISYSRAVSKMNPILLKPAIKNFSGFYASSNYFS